MIEQYT